jgi:aminoglycoside phosphotransferase (APT) family kinase protein
MTMELTSEWAARYFAAKLDCPTLTILDLVRFPRGSSRDTWFVSFRRSPRTAPEKLVVRGDWETGAIDNSPLINEYRIYRCLGMTAVPAARALWWEDEPQWLGENLPFYVRSHIEGHWDVPHFLDPDPAYDQLRIEISKEHLRNLAIVHKADWRAAGFGEIFSVPANEADCAHHFVDWILNSIEESMPPGLNEGYPILFEAAEWLHDHAPVAPRVCLCKGTNGLGEEVFRDGKIVALSDWEEAHIGDPAADFTFMQNFVPNVVHDGKAAWNLPMALDYYHSVSGIEITVAAVQYYVGVRFLRLAMTTTFASASIAMGPSPVIRKAWVATEVMTMAKRGLAGICGVLPPVAATRFAQLNQAI